MISIHALLAESDVIILHFCNLCKIFLSTLSLRRATLSPSFACCSCCISIHALLAESDTGFRGPAALTHAISIHALLAESDRSCCDISYDPIVFLSTLSLRRATHFPCTELYQQRYFYPRSPCGERPLVVLLMSNL